MEQDIREMAHKRNDRGRDPAFPSRDTLYRAKKGSRVLGDEHFRDTVAGYIESIPLDRTMLQSCPACEGVLCGLCGKCHELDRKDWHTSVACPAARHIYQNDRCVAWSYAYIFLKNVERE